MYSRKTLNSTCPVIELQVLISVVHLYVQVATQARTCTECVLVKEGTALVLHVAGTIDSSVLSKGGSTPLKGVSD